MLHGAEAQARAMDERLKEEPGAMEMVLADDREAREVRCGVGEPLERVKPV